MFAMPRLPASVGCVAALISVTGPYDAETETAED